ncbi:MAG: outer membrane beta-barrel domain-containing protein [Myxococcaceae bacterium]|nr:outer membrane beta-barrel domain-containing protein [Myxococcaceae bacterium]
MLPSSLRSMFFLAALLAAGQTVAAGPLGPGAPVFVLGQAAAAQADDDEDEPARPPDKKPDAAPAAATPAPTAPPAAPPAASGSTATSSAEQMRLVNGAPLYNPNVGVHIVEQKRFSDSGRFELTLFPVALQVNGKFTQHIGTMGQLTYHLQENFGLMITGGGNWLNSESPLQGELVSKGQLTVQPATALLWTWGVLAGVEVTPFYGKFALFEGSLGQFSVVINGGAGVGATRVTLLGERELANGNIDPATYGDTGLRFMASLGIGFRFQLGSRFTLRFEVRDVVYTARMETINGCNSADLRAMDNATRGGRPPTSAMVGPGCRAAEFDGENENGQKNSRNVTPALNLVKEPTSDVLNNVGLYAGISFLF